MILADTSVWIDHFRAGNVRLGKLLEGFGIVLHPFIIGELALGNLKNRKVVLAHLENLPSSPLASDREVRFFIDRNCLMGQGIGYVDAHLLASAALSEGALIWTFDRRLAEVAGTLGLSA